MTPLGLALPLELLAFVCVRDPLGTEASIRLSEILVPQQRWPPREEAGGGVGALPKGFPLIYLISHI